MSIVLVVAAFVTVVGALVAVTTRDARRALGGLVLGLLAAPLVADPLPGLAALGVRTVAALLGGYLLFVVVGRASRITRGSLVGLPAEALAGAAAFVIGFGSSGLASQPVGPPIALGAGLALVALAAAPVARASDALRLGIALTVLATGAELIRVGFAGTPAPLEQLLTAALTIALLGATSALAAAAITTTEGFSLREETRAATIFEAHPVAPAAVGRRAPRTWRSRRPERPTRRALEPEGHPAEAAGASPAPEADPVAGAEGPAAPEAEGPAAPAEGAATDDRIAAGTAASDEPLDQLPHPDDPVPAGDPEPDSESDLR